MKASELIKNNWMSNASIWRSLTNEQLNEILHMIDFYTSQKGFIYAQSLIDEIDKLVGER